MSNHFKIKKKLAEARLMLKALDRTRQVLEESLANNQAARVDTKRDIEAYELQLQARATRQVQRHD